MTQFMMMRINYDERQELGPLQKYSRVASKALSEQFANRYDSRRIGGWGFHECLNFAVCREDKRVRFYIPPSCQPAPYRLTEEFVIFSFTYPRDPTMPNRIIGVHAGVTVLPRDDDRLHPEGGGARNINPTFEAIAPESLTTLFVPHLEWKREENRFVDSALDWRQGNKYFKDQRYPRAILIAARAGALAAISKASATDRALLNREVQVIDRILNRYYLYEDDSTSEDIEQILINNEIRSTTKRALVDARLGQGTFRTALERRWNNTCAVSGCDIREALRASHIKPWRLSSNEERLKPENGLLLVASLDALFDRYLISFSNDGGMLVSQKIDGAQRSLLGIPGKLRKPLTSAEKGYLQDHRERFDDREARIADK